MIHFDTGTYYSSLGTGGEVVRLLELGQGLDAIVAAFSARHPDSAAEVDQSIRAFVTELKSEGLFVSSQSGASATPPELALEATERFVAPVLVKHSELEDLLKLDPIHDVEPEAGWPLYGEQAPTET